MVYQPQDTSNQPTDRLFMQGPNLFAENSWHWSSGVSSAQVRDLLFNFTYVNILTAFRFTYYWRHNDILETYTDYCRADYHHYQVIFRNNFWERKVKRTDSRKR